MFVDSLCVVVTLGGVWGKVEPVTETLEVDVNTNAFPVHAKHADATDTAVCVSAGCASFDNVTGQLRAVEVLFCSLTIAWQPLFVCVPPGFKLTVCYLENVCDRRAWSLFLCPLFLEMCLNLLGL